MRTDSLRHVSLTAEAQSVLHALPSAGVTLSKEMVIVLATLPVRRRGMVGIGAGMGQGIGLGERRGGLGLGGGGLA